MRSGISRQQGKHCEEECRDDREGWSCTSCCRCTRPWERQGSMCGSPDEERLMGIYENENTDENENKGTHGECRA